MLEQFLVGALFGLIVVALFKIFSGPNDPWGGLPNPYAKKKEKGK